MIDFANLQKMIEEKFISVQKHPTLDLYIYNYTQKAQFDRVWNNETLQCRGLIMDGKNNIVARPFPKFFNYSEAIEAGEQMPAEDFLVTEKMDGSLGILYWDGAQPCLATRGSFVSDQSIVGTAMLKLFDPKLFARKYTYLFEIIYPENRIVVDYGGMRELVLLSVIETETGREQSYEGLMDYAPYMKIVEKHDGIKDFSQIEDRPNTEGYVVTFVNGQRYKVKHDEYVRLHRIVTGINAKTIWEMLRDKKPMDQILDRVPDEFYQWFKSTKEELEQKYNYWYQKSNQAYKDALKLETRKDQALFILKHYKEFSGVVFAMLNKKPHEDIIWKMIRPRAEKPFKEDIDA